MRWVVSVEGVDTPVRSAILKSLHTCFDLSTADTERSAHPFARLLHRMVALSKTSGNMASSGSWILTAPEDPSAGALYADVARHLVSRLHLEDTRHLMIVVDVDADEAFESMVLDDPVGTRAMTLRECADVQARLWGRHADATPFPAKAVPVRCPPFLVDNPADLARTLDLVHATCSEDLTAAPVPS